MVIKMYQYLLFDADQTLFDFDRAMHHSFADTYRQSEANTQVPYTQDLLLQYEELNTAWWKKLERGECDKPTLLVERFVEFFGKIGVNADPVRFNEQYLAGLARYSFLLPDVLPVCRELAKKYTLCVITNSVASTQYTRMAASPIREYFSHIFISEEIGFEKPHPAFFAHVFRALQEPDKKEVLVIGDSLSSDISGALRSGIDACWLNPAHTPCPAELKPRYEISAITDLLRFL